MRLLRLSSILLVLVATGAGAQTPASPIEIRFDAPGFVTFDATGLRTLFPAPAAPLAFADVKELGTFLEQELNAVPIQDPVTGELLGFEGDGMVLDEPCVLDPLNGDCTPVESPIATFLAGDFGYIEIEGEIVCLVDALCEGVVYLGSNAALLESALAAAAGNSFEIAGESFASGDALRVVGVRTRQVAGGYARESLVCKSSGRFTRCYIQHGTNALSAEAFFTDASGSVVHGGSRVTCNDCLQAMRFSWGLSLRTPKPAHKPWTYHGVYGVHWGEGDEGEMSDVSCIHTGCINCP